MKSPLVFLPWVWGGAHGDVTLTAGNDSWIVDAGPPWRNEPAGLTLEDWIRLLRDFGQAER